MVRILGTLFSDALTGGTEADTIYGGGAETIPEDLADTILGGAGNDLLYGNGGDDLLVAQGDDDTVYGGVGDDSLYGGSSQTDTTDGSDALYAGVGSDWLYGNSGNDTLHGGDGTDTVYGGLGNDLIYGGNDYASGGDGSDFIAGGAGSDTIYGGEGNDRIFGGKGVNDASDAADTIDGGLGNDILYGNGGDDLLLGGAGNDTIYGGAGLNTIEGGEGTDTIIANIGDVIYGGTGIDRFVLNARTIATATTQAVVNNAEDLAQLRIKDLEAGEFLQINATDNRNISLTNDGSGNTQLTIDGQVVALLEETSSSEFSSGTVTDNTLTYVFSGGLNNNGGGATPAAAPVNSVPAAQTTNEDTSKTFNTAGGNLISVSDVDNVSLTAYTIAVAQGTLTLAQTTGLTFTTGDGTSDATMTFSGTVTNINAALNGLIYAPTANYNGADTLTITANDGTTTDVDTVGITVTAVADAPVNSVPAVQTTNEDTSKTFNTAGGNLISVSDADSASLTAYTIAVAQGTLTLAQTTGLTFTTGDGTSDTTMTFSGTVTNINAALDGLIYAPTANYNGADTLTITANDGTTTDVDTVGITVTAVADAPVNSVPAAQTTNEDLSKTFNTAGGNLITVTDVDSASLTAYTIAVAQGTLTLAQTTGLTFTTGDGTSDATMTFSGTVTNINAALDGLIYAPTANYTGADTLTITANDGTATDVDTVGITVTAINDAPVNSVPAAQTTNEDTSKTFNTAGGNLISVSDADSASLTAYTIAVAQGTLTLAQTTGLTFTTGDGTSDATMTFSGTVTNINAALDGLIYAPTANYNGADTLTITANDGTATDVDTVGITVISVNDAPTVNSPLLDRNATEDVAFSYTFAGITFQDVDVGDTRTFSVTSMLPAWLSFSAATRTFSGTPTNGDVGDVDITVRSTDGQGAYVEDTFRITTTNVNDAPVNSVPAAQTTNEDTSKTFNTAGGNLISVSDVDSASLTAYTIAVTQGTLTLAQTTGLTFTTGDGTSDATMTFSGTVTNINAALNGLIYAPTANYNGADTLTITANDGTTTDVDTVGITVTAVNDVPTLTGLDAVTFLENTVNATPQVIDAAVTFGDIDSADFNGGNLTVTYSVGGGAEDSLSVRHEGNGAGQIGVSGATISYAGTAIGTITTNGAAGANLVISFNSSATPTAVDALIQNLTYANSSNTPTATRTISITANDGDGGTSAAATAVITVTAEADAAPLVALSSLNGTNGFRLDGVTASDYSGSSVASAGDVNGDGFEDMIVGAFGGDPGGDNLAGESYVVFGKASGWAAAIDLNTLDGTTGFRLDGIDAFDQSGFSVASAGDVNGDGYDDVIVGANGGDPVGDSSAGESYVVFGKAGGWAATIDLNTLDGTTGFRLDGIDVSDISGRSVASAGDVNGDGYADMIIGAMGGDSSAGESYVVFGKAGGWAASIDLSTLNGTTGFRLDGIDAYDRSGRSVASAGDVNGDGFDDMIVGAYYAGFIGESYVVFGKASGWAASLDLSTLNGTTGFRLDGIDAFDYSGFSVASAGDVNGDGFEDVIIGATGGDPGGNGYAGESYVLFGKASGWAAAIDLNTLDGTTGFRLDGIDASDQSGCSVASAGDVNGDGYDDVIVGALGGDPGGDLTAGESYVVFGKAAGWAANIDLNTLDGTTGFRLDGIDMNDRSGVSVASAGDVNGDGFDDLIIGAYGGAPGGDLGAGESYVIFGNNDSGAATAVGTSGADTISGTMGNDVIVAGLGNDVVSGFDGNDVIKGANGDDALYGNAGTDKLFGGNGADTLVGGAGVDTLEGGDGIDRFTFTATTDTGDMITDFNASADLLVFSGLLTGAFSFVGAHGNAFAGGGNSSARFNDTTKLLEIDTDGNAAADMSITLKGVELANLSAADFSWS